MLASKFEFGIILARSLVVFILTLAASALAAEPAPAKPEPSPPSTPREFFNMGTTKLNEGKWREAESFLESALASQDQRFQPPALYNLGHVRFQQGLQELKKAPPAGPTAARSRAASQLTDQAMLSADEALAGSEVQKLVASYLRGRGARKELKAALAAVRLALEKHGAALAKWQRASGDFKGALELSSADPEARHNAEVVDRCIAKLVDSVQQLQQLAGALGDKRCQLGDKLKQLKGRIPASDMPPGAAGDEDEEDEDSPLGPELGPQEGPSKEGQEMTLSREQAGWLLQSFKLDSDRRLPMGGDQPAEPRTRTRPTW